MTSKQKLRMFCALEKDPEVWGGGAGKIPPTPGEAAPTHGVAQWKPRGPLWERGIGGKPQRHQRWPEHEGEKAPGSHGHSQPNAWVPQWEMQATA